MTVGLTGQSGAGKTTVSEVFKRRGFAVINCDLVAREVTEAGSECCKALALLFPDCFDEAFALDRAKLAQAVFSDREKLKILDDAIYPFITERIKEHIAVLSRENDNILLDAPTLYEAGADSLCDKVVGVIADDCVRLRRVTARDGITEEQALKRFSSQHSAEFFEHRCNYVIDNSFDIALAEKETDRIIDKLLY
ncbi:MAG: dephospho-CoA kinase [Ruminococcus sp.]|nr:dephospho-CoA kinase [Ruminococcus sp.]